MHSWKHSIAAGGTRVLLLGGLLLRTAGAPAQDYYIDAQNGDNWNDGSAGAPWKTVNFALTGPHAPLPVNSTLHLYGTNGVSYGADNGEPFPWVLYNNISIVADSSAGSGTDWIVDAVESGQNIIELSAVDDFPSSRIQGISDPFHRYDLILRNGRRGIVSEPAGKTHAPTIQYCSFENTNGEAIRIAGSDATLGHLIRNNILQSIVAAQIHCEASNCSSTVVIENNELSGGRSDGIDITGTLTGGAIVVRGNYISSNSARYRTAILFNAFHGRVECVDNIVSYSGYGCDALDIFVCGRWDPLSRIDGNLLLNAYYYALYISTTNGVVFTNNTCTGTARHDGIRLYQSDDVILSGNLLSGAYRTGIYLEDSDRALIENNTVRSSGDSGIDLFYGSSDAILRNNNFYANKEWGMYITSPNAKVVNNTITANTAGGLYVNSSGAMVFQNTILTNGGPGIQDDTCDGSSYMHNLVAQNSGDGIQLTANTTPAPPKIYNNTVAANGAHGIWTALASGTPLYVANCIFSANGDLDISGLTYSQYMNCCARSGIWPGHGNLRADPLFVDAGNGDYHLSSASPCIDAGSNTMVEHATDLDGVPSILDGAWNGSLTADIGCYEYTEVSSTLSGSYQQGGDLELTVKGPANAPFSVYAATDTASYPLAADPGLLHPRYGTVLLDVARLYSETPVAGGSTDSTGTATLTLPLPPGSAGRYVALQTAVDAPDGSGHGQGTEAETFVIQP